jgi:mannose-6-phosphate isomerase-like protein (cupin superfamily)
MHIAHADASSKGWYGGPWNWPLPVSLGYANEGIDEPHLHRTLTEIYMVGRGTSEIRIEDRTVALQAGDVVVVEPGEAHTFLRSSRDYFHFVVHVSAHTPAVENGAGTDKVIVDRSRLSL